MKQIILNTSCKGIKRIFIIHPNNYSSHIEELIECAEKIKSIASENFHSFRILKMTVFISSSDYNEFNKLKIKLREFIVSKSEFFNIPVLFVAQAPADNKNIAIELTAILLSADDYKYSYQRNGNNAICKVDYGNYFELYGAIDSGIEESVYKLSSIEFEELKFILHKNNLSFENIVRQWGYVGGITNYELCTVDDNDSKMENYQMFNKARAEFYKQSEWKYGYPSATGIGVNVKGCSIEFITINVNSNNSIIPLHNPKQSDAHRYTGNQFTGKGTVAYDNEADNPKFERGKVVVTENFFDLYVSGTAAIIGEDSVSGDIRIQTYTTIDNIFKLCSKENLAEHGIILDNDLHEFSGVRAYIKYQKDVKKVENICKDAFGDTPILYVIADVCREELLVEIEAFLNCKINKSIQTGSTI